MIVYICLIAFCMFFSFLSVNSKKDKQIGKLIIDIMPFVLLFIVSAIRYKVGRDYISYYNLFYNSKYILRMDFGFVFLYKILNFFRLTPISIFIVTSFVINWFVYLSINKLSKNKTLSYYIYICGTLYFFSMNGIRQSIAMCIFYYSLFYIEKRDLKKYILLNLLGASIHSSALLFIPLYFVFTKKTSLKFKIIFLLVVYGSSNIIFPHLVNMINGTKYSIYMVKDAYEVYGTFSVSSIINILLMFGYGFVDIDKIENRIYSNIHFVAAIISIFLPILPLANRLFIAFRYIEFISVPNLLLELKIKKSYGQMIKFAIYILYFVYFINGVYFGNSNSVLPYETIFKRS